MRKEKIVKSLEEKKAINSRILSVLSILLMAVSVCISLRQFTNTSVSTGLFGRIKTTMETVSIRPDLKSAIVGCILYAAVIIRFRIFSGKRTVAENIPELLTAALDILFFASFLTIFTGTKTVTIISIKVSSYTVLAIAVFMSWLGMKAIAGISWILLLLIGMGNMNKVSVAMGFLGAVYIICAFLSFIIQIGNLGMFTNFASDFMVPAIKDASANMREEIIAGGKAVGDGAKAVVNTATKVAGMAAGIPPQVTTAITEKSGD